jgi:hypothetical protein
MPEIRRVRAALGDCYGVGVAAQVVQQNRELVAAYPREYR